MGLNNIRNPALFTDGGHHDAEVFRLGFRAFTGNQEGVVERGTLKATADGVTPNLITLAGGGGALVKGRDNAFQGTYFVGTTGNTTVDTPTSGPAPESHMVMVRVQDPEYDGSSTRDPDVDVAYAHIEACAAGATDVPAGYSATEVCRIDLPANTSVVQQAHIKDLRKLAIPRKDRTFLTSTPGAVDDMGNSTGWVAWPDAARQTVFIPEWATQAIVKVDLGGVVAKIADIFGYLRANLSTAASPAVSPSAGIDININTPADPLRTNLMVGGTIPIPVALRGTSQQFHVDGRRADAGQTGVLSAYGPSFITWDVQFEETVE